MIRTDSVSTREAWLEARKNLLLKEKAHARAGDELAAERRALPHYPLGRDYIFDGVNGKVSLAELFAGRSQLIVQHFMFSPDWEAGCPFCSFWADGYDPMIVHLNQRDVSFAVVSRCSVETLEQYRRRMGWKFNWVSALNNSFNYDFCVTPTPEQIESGCMVYNFRETPVHSSECHGVSVFRQNDEGVLFHTYSTYARGLDPMNAAYAYLDITPAGRNEEGLPFGMAWVKRHDEYVQDR